jgi:adenylosuccinate lyase
MTNPLAPSSLLTPLISSAAMRAIVDDRARLQRMLDFEIALARAQAAVGIIPALATDATTSRRSAKRRSPSATSPSR